MPGTLTKTQPQNDGSHVHGLPDGEIQHDNYGYCKRTMRRLFILGARIFTVIMVNLPSQGRESTLASSSWIMKNCDKRQHNGFVLIQQSKVPM